jgi:hypothetical protein
MGRFCLVVQLLLGQESDHSRFGLTYGIAT